MIFDSLGIPVILMGRTNEVAFGFTYGFMDCIDYFVEEINDDKYKKDNEFLPVTKEVEQILRQGEAPLNITVYRTHHGIVDVPEDQTGPLNGKIQKYCQIFVSVNQTVFLS